MEYEINHLEVTVLGEGDILAPWKERKELLAFFFFYMDRRSMVSTSTSVCVSQI